MAHPVRALTLLIEIRFENLASYFVITNERRTYLTGHTEVDEIVDEQELPRKSYFVPLASASSHIFSKNSVASSTNSSFRV